MNEGEFERAASVVEAAGFRTAGSHYDKAAFGSWHIVFTKGDERFRMIWDGRDRWLVLQRHNCQVSDLWTDLWIGKSSTEWSPERLLAELRSDN